jgi:hypothetical protein
VRRRREVVIHGRIVHQPKEDLDAQAIYSMSVSLDGFIAGLDGAIDWSVGRRGSDGLGRPGRRSSAPSHTGQREGDPRAPRMGSLRTS